MARSEMKRPLNRSNTELTAAKWDYFAWNDLLSTIENQYTEKKQRTTALAAVYNISLERTVLRKYVSVCIGSVSWVTMKDIWGFQLAVVWAAMNLLQTKILCFHSFLLHPLSLLSLGSCFGTFDCFLYCIQNLCQFLLLCGCFLCFTLVCLCQDQDLHNLAAHALIYHVLVPIVLAEPLLMGSFPSPLREWLLLFVAVCSACNTEMFFCSCTSVYKKTCGRPFKRKVKVNPLLQMAMA